MTTVNLNAAYFPAIELFTAVGTMAILVYGGFQAIDGAITIGVIVAFIAALNNFFDPITQLSQLYTTYQSGMAALDKIFELLDVEPDVVEAPEAVGLGGVAGGGGVVGAPGDQGGHREGRRAVRPDLAVPVEGHEGPLRVDVGVDHRELQTVPFGDLAPVRDRRTTQRVGADTDAGLLDPREVDDVRQGHLLAREGEKLPREARGACGCVRDRAHVDGARIVGVERLREQVAAAPDRCNDVVEIVSKAAGEAGHRFDPDSLHYPALAPLAIGELVS